MPVARDWEGARNHACTTVTMYIDVKMDNLSVCMIIGNKRSLNSNRVASIEENNRIILLHASSIIECSWLQYEKQFN